MRWLVLGQTTGLIVLGGILGARSAQGGDGGAFQEQVAPILRGHCLRCHQGATAQGNLDLTRPSGVIEGVGAGWAVVPGDLEASRLIQVISGPKPTMPKAGDHLTPEQVATLRDWVAAGAPWPDGEPLRNDPLDWWSLRPLRRPAVPRVDPARDGLVRNPVDAFVLERLAAARLDPSPEADRRTLIRRVTFDLIGLPPDPEAIREFVADPAPDAFERLVDRLLASPRYGERWGRHWLDVAHYADTHGYDKDQPRPHAWPYRDYVIRALNADKPYGQFVQEQVAGDVLFPGTRDGTEATGFLAAGPWDLIGHAEVPESKVDGQIARLLDRDDMVTTTLNTFSSLTVQCARCHDHKFDPVSQDDYYGLQAVFAALDRTDRVYDADPKVAARRADLTQRAATTTQALADLRALATDGPNGAAVAALDQAVLAAEAAQRQPRERPAAFGYHSGISDRADSPRWVRVDLGRSVPIASVVLYPCDDDFRAIGPGFGFPVRSRVEASDDPDFGGDVVILSGERDEDQPNPGLTPVLCPAPPGLTARYVRVWASRLASRRGDYHLALAELAVLDHAGTNQARGAAVTALDTIEAPPRWGLANLVDGVWPLDPGAEVRDLTARRDALVAGSLAEVARGSYLRLGTDLAAVRAELATLPPLDRVYAAGVHHGAGAFRGTGPDGGRPRTIRVLARGDVRSPRQVAHAGAVPIIAGVPARFALAEDAPEGDRRAALARWLVARDNPLTWRSIVNRVWQYHFGRGLVESPNDFGRMGRLPSHPDLLDWLAADFRDGDQSLKALHRRIVTSATYRQSSLSDPSRAAIDSDNTLLWRMNRRRLEAEAIRDTALSVAGRLDLAAGGPGWQDFAVEQPAHSPHYQYAQADPDDPRTHRRSVYRFVVRSQPQPLLTALDCADPSVSVDRRTESTTALQALALRHDRLLVRLASHLADRLGSERPDLPSQVDRAVELTLGRSPTATERAALISHAERRGLASVARILFNLNEFVFVD